MFFFPKRWRVRKNRSKVQVSPEVAALNARGPWGLFGAFWGISWMTLMTTKEKAAKEVLAQAQAPPTLGQQQATKGSIYIYIALGFSIIGGRVYIIPKREQYICIWYITYVCVYIYILPIC